jgi:hypothetical protein
MTGHVSWPDVVVQAAIAETLTKKNELLEQANEQMQAAHKVTGEARDCVCP